VLDAQYFGVAQRRRRVFVVASARKDCDPAKILFEFDGVRRDSAPSREAGQETAGTLASRTGAGGCPGTDEACSGYLQAFGGGNTGGSIDVGTCLTTSGQRLDFDTETFAVQSVCVTGEITHTLKAEGFDADRYV
jgi:DNA (cytosine-5)-methyltransferase 1